jgi:NADH-quinone oxidoreductase subunit M
LLILVFGFFPDSVLKTNQMAAEAWLSRLLDQPELESNELAGLVERL